MENPSMDENWGYPPPWPSAWPGSGTRNAPRWSPSFTKTEKCGEKNGYPSKKVKSWYSKLKKCNYMQLYLI
jgi:hypothetical protein